MELCLWHSRGSDLLFYCFLMCECINVYLRCCEHCWTLGKKIFVSASKSPVRLGLCLSVGVTTVQSLPKVLLFMSKRCEKLDSNDLATAENKAWCQSHLTPTPINSIAPHTHPPPFRSANANPKLNAIWMKGWWCDHFLLLTHSLFARYQSWLKIESFSVSFSVF